MKNISSRDLETLSAYLDGQLTSGEKVRLESRLKTEPELTAALGGLSEVRAVLRRAPRRRAPRRFTLTPKMAGVKPPVPRLVPAFSWASAVAALFFILTLGSNMLGRFSFGAAAPMADAEPMLAAEPMGIGGGEAPEEQAVSETAVDSTNGYLTATPESLLMVAPEEPAPEADTRAVPSEDEQQLKVPPPLNPWLVVWPALALVFIATALLVRWLHLRAFHHRNKLQ